ncbi:hypothetical protein [Vibrio alginolyticus]|uniref:hypothetical protein n=1 Tax=Vibrio alginolyticus TaxID=663 RepID=UPI003D7CCC2F
MRVNRAVIGADPIKYYAKLIGMEKYLSRLRQQANSVVIMTGIVLYRELPKNKQSEVLRKILDLPDNQLKSALYGLASQVVANPYWFSWSLSDKELRKFFDTNNDVTDAIKLIGIDITIPITVASVAGVLYKVSEKGVKEAPRHISKQFKKTITSTVVTQVASKVGLNETNAKRASAILVIMVSIIACQTHSNSKSAQEELLRRGLLKAGDL